MKIRDFGRFRRGLFSRSVKRRLPYLSISARHRQVICNLELIPAEASLSVTSGGSAFQAASDSRSASDYRLDVRRAGCDYFRAFEATCHGAFDASLPETTMHGDERNIFLSTMPATSRDRMRRARRRRRLGGAVRLRRAVCRRAACPGPGVHCELSVRARDQRPDHRRPAVFAVRDLALAGAAAARERIFVHGRWRRSSTP